MEELIIYNKSTDLYSDAVMIIDQSQKAAYRAVDQMLILRNWMLGKRIAEEELSGGPRALYGERQIETLAEKLRKKYGKGYSRRLLYEYLRFYRLFPDIVHISGAQTGTDKTKQIVHLSSAQFRGLSWSHYRKLLQVEDPIAREWYLKETIEQIWSVAVLQRNISSQYYYRMLKTQDPQGVEAEMLEITSPYQDKLEYIRNPVIAEFLDMQQNTKYHESDLEQAIIDNLQKFLMELGKGYAFVGRQQHIHTEKEDYFIDLVFYNYILKCFILIDLKTSKITHQDVGQMDMYIRMYDELKKQEDDNPTLGIVLCSDTDEDIARYSILHGNEQLFASKYKLFLPTEEELRAEIEAQKRFFEMQHAE